MTNPKKPATTLVNINGEIRDAKTMDAPKDRTFRSAWQIGQGTAIVVDMDAARDIQRDTIRKERAEAFVELNIAVTNAALQGGDAKPLRARHLALLDAPASPKIDEAKTPETLAQVTLEVVTA